MFRFNRTYFLLALLLLIVEILIALFVRDAFLRPYGGDTIAVWLLYCLVRSIFRLPWLHAAIGCWVFACCLEVVQATNILTYLGLKKNEIANVIAGNTFAWLDILAYTAGLLIIIVIEKAGRHDVSRAWKNK